MPTAPAAASPRLAAAAPRRHLVFSRAAFQMLISALVAVIYSGCRCGICQALSNLLAWLPIPCLALVRQAGSMHLHCSWGPQVSLRTARHSASAGSDPTNPWPSGTMIRRHRRRLPLPSRFLMGHQIGNEHLSHHDR